MNESKPLDIRLHHSSMLRRFGWFHKLLGLGRTLKRLDLDRASVQRILDANQEGPLVYVLLRGSNLDYLALNHVLNERRLPLAVWANGLSHRWWEPWPEMARGIWNRLRGRGERAEPTWLTKQIQSGHALTVCLEPARQKRVTDSDPLAAIISAQKTQERPIQLIPVLVVWRRAPTKSTNPSLRFLMDRTPITSTFRQIANVVLRSRHAFVQVGEPVRLPELMNRVPEPRQSRALRILLRRFLKRETNLIRGPRLVSRKDMMELVLNNPPMREIQREEIAATGQSEKQVQRKMEREYRQIAARFRYWIIPVLDLVLRPMWTKVYSGVDIPPEDLERIRSAMRKGSVVLAPCHKSHFDYVLISWVFYDNKLIIPHVVAGANLALPIISWVLRSAGGFFIKRSFAGERLHPKILARYIQELTRQGYPIEFYIEGGRTRSGKFLAPKLGILSMLLDAAAVRPSGQEITILPISIGYDRVAEQSAYAKELGGQRKTQESLGEFAKATGVLRNRYGRVYIRVGEPLPSSSLVDPKKDQGKWKDLSRNERGEILQFAAERIIHRMGTVTVIMPKTLVAMGLLAHHRRGITHEDLMLRLHRFQEFLTSNGALFARTLKRFEQAVSVSLSQFENQGLIESTTISEKRIWSVSVQGRIDLDYYKNHGLHYLSQMGLAAATIRGHRKAVFGHVDVMTNFAALHWMLRKEFIFDPDVAVSDHLRRGLEQLRDYGALESLEDGYKVADVHLISEIYGLFRSVIEAYWLVLHKTGEHSLDAKDTIKRLHQDGDTLISSGVISRPETITEINLKNAVRALTEDGVIHSNKKGHLEISESHRQAVMKWLNPMVNE